MSDIKFSVSWDSYHNYVSKGFSSLQQNGEFVDMTLAADGHLVKVHQNIVALASPYLKAMLQTATCRHPVIFLHNINSDILGYILEYIYTGEVKIPISNMDKFVEACKSLYINGLDTITSKNTSEAESANQRIDKPVAEDIAAHITINTQDNNIYNLEVIPNHNTIVTNNNTNIFSDQPSTISHDNQYRNSEIVDTNGINNLLVLKPNTGTYNDKELSRINTDSNIKILSNIVLSAPIQNGDIEKSTNMESNAVNCVKESIQSSSSMQLQENPINIQISSDIYHMNSNSNIVKKEILISEEENSNNIAINAINWRMQEHSWNPNTNVVDVTTLEDVLQPEPGQSNEHTKLYTQMPQDTFHDLMVTEKDEIAPIVIKIKNSKVLKNLKKIASHMKLKNKSEELPRMTLNRVNRIKMDKLPHFTISNRGSLQLILNRFLYHTHHYSYRGRKRRWRCVEYRKLHCPAFVDTDNEEIMAMSVDHLHPNHENIIRQKIKANIVFTSLSNAVKTINKVLTDQQAELKHKSVKKSNKVNL